MAKLFFSLPNYYEGLRARRVQQSGRLWLVKIINDPPAYWLVFIRNFNLEQDKASGAKSIGSWRFTLEADALAKFAALKSLYPPYPKREPTGKQIAARARFAQKHRKSSNELAR